MKSGVLKNETCGNPVTEPARALPVPPLGGTAGLASEPDKMGEHLSVIKPCHYPTIEQMDWEAENPNATKQIKGEDK